MARQKLLEETGSYSSQAMTRGQLSSMMSSVKWRDEVHEKEGGCDTIGPRPQDGRNVLEEEMEKWMNATDDVTGAELKPGLVRKARSEEMAFFKEMNAYTRCPRSRVTAEGGKLIDVRWIDTNKGDSEDPNYRSRLVGRDFNTYKDDSLYAATPPLEALRLIISHAATVRGGGQGHGKVGYRELMVNDVSRAYFYAPATRSLFIELPEEDVEAGEGEVGRLNVCLYGTRDAAREWQQTLSRHLEGLGFKRGVGHPAVFFHPMRGIMTLVHGDDYVSAAVSSELDWLQAALESQYKIKTQRTRPQEGKEQVEAKILNRIVRRTREGYEVEADPRHAELIIEQVVKEGSRTLSTPGIGQTKEETEEVELEGEQATNYRAIAARCNYLSQDRPDLQFAVKETCREMPKPTMSAWSRLEIIGQYLKAKPRLIWRFSWQEASATSDVYADANWAGCRRTRKTPRGGCVMLGQHCIKTWSKTQSLIAKSSAESELYGIVKALCEALGTLTLMEELGKELKA